MFRLARAAAADDNLQLPIGFKILNCQGSNLAAAKGIVSPLYSAEMVVDRHFVSGTPHDNFQIAIASQIGHCNARPDSIAARSPPLQTAGQSVQCDDVVGSPDDLKLGIAIQIGDRR